MEENVLFKELKEVDLNTVSQIHALFPHWRVASVQKKLNATIEGKDKRFVGVNGGKIIAHVRLVSQKGLHKHRTEVTSLIVEQRQRRQHIGTELMKNALACVSPAKKIVILAVDSKNKSAINLYKKLGFVRYGLLKKASLVNGKFVDNYLMKKDLS